MPPRNPFRFYFTPEDEVEVGQAAGGWALVGDPALPSASRGIFIRRADNHLVHFFFNGAGEWEQWDVTQQVGSVTISGDPTVSQDGHSVFVRTTNNHLA